MPKTSDDLDIVGYLIANTDVANSGLSPREHHVARGKAEGRQQAINLAEIKSIRESKLARLAFKTAPGIERALGEAPCFLSKESVAEFAIPDSPPVSVHPYPESMVQRIRENREKLVLDLGTGPQPVYYHNVVNTEIYKSLSTDVICVGEALPFADEQFDFVFCFATLEHIRRPWDVAREICRVLKPGGTMVIDCPFMQPVHGYPHHYFNANPVGDRSLFESDCDICSVEIGYHLAGCFIPTCNGSSPAVDVGSREAAEIGVRGDTFVSGHGDRHAATANRHSREFKRTGRRNPAAK